MVGLGGFLILVAWSLETVPQCFGVMFALIHAVSSVDGFLHFRGVKFLRHGLPSFQPYR